jgi:hypothetical protein
VDDAHRTAPDLGADAEPGDDMLDAHARTSVTGVGMDLNPC